MKKKSIRMIFLILVILCILGLFNKSLKAINTNSYTSYKIVSVKSGDTLWAIVKNNCTNYNDIRKVIYDIKDLNNISSDITPGQKIMIPDKYTR